MTDTKRKEDKSVLEDKDKFQEAGAKEKVAHMGDKPGQASQKPKERDK